MVGQVAVKVQRPGIRDEIVADMEAIESIAEFVDAHTDVRTPLRVRADGRKSSAGSSCASSTIGWKRATC